MSSERRARLSLCVGEYNAYNLRSLLAPASMGDEAVAGRDVTVFAKCENAGKIMYTTFECPGMPLTQQDAWVQFGPVYKLMIQSKDALT